MTTAALACDLAAAPATASRRTRIERDAVADVAPVLVALAPFAAIIGVQISGGHDIVGGLSGSLLLYAGSAQVSALSLLAQGAGILSILGTVALINARFLVYGAVLAQRFADQPKWFRLLGPHFIVDQTYALASARHDLSEAARFRRYWLTVGLTIAGVWASAMTVGALIGPAVPASPATAFLPIAAFVGLLVAAVRDRPSVAAALAGCAVALLAPVVPGLRVLLGTATGAAVGLATERALR
jgi:predicted branched-subunit amino acid permease